MTNWIVNFVKNLPSKERWIIHFSLSIIVLISFSVFLNYAFSIFPVPQLIPYLQTIQYEENFPWLRFLLSVLLVSGYCFISSLTSFLRHVFQAGSLERPFGLSFSSIIVVFIVSMSYFVLFVNNRNCSIPYVTIKVEGYEERFSSENKVLVPIDKQLQIKAIADEDTDQNGNELICNWLPENGIQLTEFTSCTTLLTKKGEKSAYLSLSVHTNTCQKPKTIMLFFLGNH